MYQHDTLKLSYDAPLRSSSVSDLHKETNTCPPKPILDKEDGFLSSPPSPIALHNSLHNSDYLFCVRYITENTVKATLFLVQINHAETLTLGMDSNTTGDYHFSFLSRHPEDDKLYDDKVRWWLLQYEYVNNSNNVPVMEHVYCQDQNVNLIRINTFFGPTLFI